MRVYQHLKEECKGEPSLQLNSTLNKQVKVNLLGLWLPLVQQHWPLILNYMHVGEQIYIGWSKYVPQEQCGMLGSNE